MKTLPVCFALLPLIAGAATAALAQGAQVQVQSAPDPAGDAIVSGVAALEPRLAGMANDVWSWAEIGFKETKSAGRLRGELQQAGFRVRNGVAGMPTAFIAEAGSGGPVIALLAEFDALPGLAQAAVPAHSPIEGQAAGHACGHNLLGAASVTAAIAIKNWLAAQGLPGTVRLYGTPAEEGGFAKVYMVRDGLFNDVDVTLSWHPGDRNSTTPSRSLAMISGKFTFTGVASHASVAPERGRSALDGVEVMNVAANFLREHVPQTTRIQYVITRGGDQPNIVPAMAQNFYFVRSPDAATLRDVWSRIVKASEGAALATGTTVSYEVLSGAYDTLPNVALNTVMHDSLARVGGYAYTSDEAAYAAQIVTTYTGAGPGRVTSPGDPAAIEPMGPPRQGFASSDVGDVSWVTPTATLSTATFVRGTSAHSWQAAATSGTTIGVKGALVAAKTIALAATRLYRDPALIDAARKEFAERRGDGFAYTSLLGDRAPALDYNER